MPSLTREEMETHINQTGDNHDEWEVFSDDPVLIRRLDKIADRVEARGEGFVYKLSSGQVILAKKRIMSPSHKKKSIAALEKARNDDSES